MKLGRREHFDSVGAEILQRILRVLRILLLVPITLLTFPIGCLLRALAFIGTPTITYQRFQAEDLSQLPVTQFTLLTQNLGMIPVVSEVNALAKPIDRCPNLRDFLHKYSADVIVFQEAFDESARQFLVDEFHYTHPYILSRVGPRFHILNSGLFVLSKYPIHLPFFRSYGIPRTVDRCANKGVVLFAVSLCTPEPGQPAPCIVIGSTHNQSEGHPGVRSRQYEMITEFMHSYIATIQTHHAHELRVIGAIFAGDFNFGPLRSSLRDTRFPFLRENVEWEANKSFLDHYHNFFYEQTPEGALRLDCRQHILQYGESLRTQGQRMDAFAALNELRRYISTRSDISVNHLLRLRFDFATEQDEPTLDEIIAQSEPESPMPGEATISFSDALHRLTLLDLLPGTSIKPDFSDGDARDPVANTDIDHILVWKYLNGIVSGRHVILTGSDRFTDHCGKLGVFRLQV
mmetsp:Transcript_10216/g.25665  ORF Transcript_10216/g.25665 Transcript_10216/m.25665 type:complete len:461 (+) Transcript_10216:149-1531(+)